MLNARLVSWALGIWAGITFVLCVIYGLVTPRDLGMQTFLEQILSAFSWLTWWGFLLVESFLYGAYAGWCSVRSTTGSIVIGGTPRNLALGCDQCPRSTAKAMCRSDTRCRGLSRPGRP